MSSGRPPATAQPLARLALAAVLVVGCAGGVAVAQSPAVPLPPDPIDDTLPLPPHDAKQFADMKWRPKGGAFRLDTDRKVFKGSRDPKTGAVKGGVEDDRPLASEKQNPDEAEAWAEVVVHAAGFAAAELEAHAAADLTPDDLVQPIRRFFRYELVRFDGTITKVRRVAPTAAVASRSGPPVLYEAWLVPVDESPANPVRVVFSALPDGFPGPALPAAGQPAGEWLDVNRWVTFAGFYFKLTSDPDGSHRAPVLVGKSVTPLSGPPAEATDVKLATRYRVFRLVRDDAPISREAGHWEEGSAWTRVLLHARKFENAALEAAAQKSYPQGVTFADLFQTGRADYQFQPVVVKGRLIRVKRMDSPKRLAEAGIPYCYEAWIVPNDEPRGNPVCVVLTELPEGVEPAPLMNRQVTVGAYSFKLFHYESAEPKKDDPTRHEWKKAPLLIGRGLTLVIDTTDGPSVWGMTFLPLLVGGLLLMALIAFGLSRWYRAGDRRARAEFEAARVSNPFTD